jgi:phosphoribosylformylglycinamidine synthase
VTVLDDHPSSSVADLATTMGLTSTEFDHIVAELGRLPNRVELAVFAGMWSEHCSYKSTRELLATLPTTGPRVLAGPGAHAGCVDVGDGWAVAFKVESHNHPSAVEPYQGALTGVGGILRDVVAQGARPVAVMDGLCFGDPESSRTRWLRDGVVAGIGAYGNSYGVPNVGGVTVYDERYQGNPLVNALAAGLVRHDEMRTAAAAGTGNVLLYVGATTGRDGILGAAFASEELGDTSDHASRRSHVQVGDPFTGKKLMEACLSFTPGDGLIAGQDLGACGIACATSEMAAAGGVGFDVDLDAVPLRETDIEPAEILLSESQERFLLVVDRNRVEAAIDHFRGHGVHAAAIGTVTATGRVTVRRDGDIVADLPADLVADGTPVQRWEAAAELPAPQPYPSFAPPDDLGTTLLALLARPGLGDAAPLYERYDQTVGNRTIRGPGAGEAAVLRIPGTSRAFALDLVGRGDECAVDPYLGVQTLLGAAVRNLACVGAETVAVTDGLNVGSPSDPVEFARLSEVIRGLGDGLRQLGLAVTGGNCSLYNESPHGAIPPTPMIGALGVIADHTTVPRAHLTAGEVLFFCGEPRHDPTLSAYGRVMTDRDGPAPVVDLDADARLARLLVGQSAAGIVGAAKDVGRGGAAVALAALCMRSSIGATVDAAPSDRADWTLFGEYPGCAWVAVDPSDADRFAAAAAAAGTPARRAGLVGGDRLVVSGHIDVPIERLTESARLGAA